MEGFDHGDGNRRALTLYVLIPSRSWQSTEGGSIISNGFQIWVPEYLMGTGVWEENIRIYIYTHIRTYTYIYVHTHVYTCIYMCIFFPLEREGGCQWERETMLSRLHADNINNIRSSKQ